MRHATSTKVMWMVAVASYSLGVGWEQYRQSYTLHINLSLITVHQPLVQQTLY